MALAEFDREHASEDTLKARKVMEAAEQLASELESLGRRGSADEVRLIVDLPFDTLVRLHDLLKAA